MINKFFGKYRFLSNFYPSKATSFAGRSCPTVEHAYQAYKTKVVKERAFILSRPTPGQAKLAGKKATMREDWDKIKLPLMGALIREKFFGDQELMYKLIATGDEELVESNNWRDTFWGVCNGVGKNHLGKILMEVREELKKEYENYDQS